jgi:hypothetical protein
MARGAIVDVVLNSRNGVTWPGSETTGDPANGHYFVWGPRKVLHVRNTSGATPYNITFTPQSTQLDIFAAPAKVVSVPANGQRLFGPFPSYYMHPEDSDRVYVDVGNAALIIKVWDMGQG